MIKILFVTEAEDDYWCVINLNHEVFYNLLLLGITLCACAVAPYILNVGWMKSWPDKARDCTPFVRFRYKLVHEYRVIFGLW